MAGSSTPTFFCGNMEKSCARPVGRCVRSVRCERVVLILLGARTSRPHSVQRTLISEYRFVHLLCLMRAGRPRSQCARPSLYDQAQSHNQIENHYYFRIAPVVMNDAAQHETHKSAEGA